MASIDTGPLAGVRVVEFASIGPAPHGCMLLSGLGADVLRITRPGVTGWPNTIVDRGRHSIELDLRNDDGRGRAVEALRLADVAVEGYRPSVMGRLGLGPTEMSALNPRLIYGRVTGWSQSGALAKTAGHDINFIGLSGALRAISGAGRRIFVGGTDRAGLLRSVVGKNRRTGGAGGWLGRPHNVARARDCLSTAVPIENP